MSWRGWSDALLELVLPGSHPCYFCQEEIKEQKIRGVCDNCTEKILWLDRRNSICPRCGCFTALTPCPNCCDWDSKLKRVVSVAPYQGIYREMVTELKYAGRLELVKPLGYLMACRLQHSGLARKDAILVPVPLHPLREKERGFNQSACLAQEVAARLGLRYEQGALQRVHYVNSQARLGKKERLANINKAFAADKKGSSIIVDHDIILIDDILTTGATLNACAETLFFNGARSVIAAVWASGVRTAKKNTPRQEKFI